MTNETNRIGLKSVISQNKELDATDIDGEKVMMNLNKGRYYGLNSVGSRIWELVEEPKAVVEVVNIIKNEYDVEDNICEASVLEFLLKLLNEDIICVIG